MHAIRVPCDLSPFPTTYKYLGLELNIHLLKWRYIFLENVLINFWVVVMGNCKIPEVGGGNSCVFVSSYEVYNEMLWSLFWSASLCYRYKLGFCPNGPDCRYRHAKLPAPPPPVEEVLQKIQQLASYNHGNANRFYQNRNPNYSQQAEKPQYQQIPNGANQVSKTIVTESPNIQQRLQQSTPSQPAASQVQPQNISNGQQTQANRSSTPLPQGTSRCVQSYKVFY